FPQEGVVCYPGGAGLLEEALRLGADCVGAIPHYEWTREDGIKELEQVFELAQKHGRMVDVHCDETDDESSRFLEHVAALTVKYSMQGRVVAGHTTAMHSYNNAYAFKLIRQLARSGISIVTNPLDNSVLQGRFDTYPKRRGLTRVKELLEAGVNVAIGHDSVVDPWYPLGRGQILQAAFVLFHMCQMSGRSEQQAIIDMVTKGGSVAMALDEYGIEVGKQADMLIMDVEDEFDLLRLLPLPRWVVKAGRVIAETRPAQTYVNMQSSVTNGLAEKQTTYRAIDFRCREEK
ncbi:MAG: amidohydrolase family protein, partial [Blastocatellia bacterium]|nr:amidohydrolase family protein [Blastocatellia bacterium]